MEKSIAAIAVSGFLGIALYHVIQVSHENAEKAAARESELLATIAKKDKTLAQKDRVIAVKSRENQRLTARVNALTGVDKVNALRNEQNAFLNDIAKLIAFAESRGIKMTFGEAFRTAEQQKLYVDANKSQTMNSNHLRRLAVDFNFFINGRLTWDKEKLQELGDYWESLNTKNRWGGNFKTFMDVPHFERNVPDF